MFIVHIPEGTNLSGDQAPACIPELLLPHETEVTTSHIILNTEDIEVARRLLKKLMEFNPELQRLYTEEGITVTYSPVSKNAIMGIVVVHPLPYDGKLYIRRRAQPIEQEIVPWTW